MFCAHRHASNAFRRRSGRHRAVYRVARRDVWRQRIGMHLNGSASAGSSATRRRRFMHAASSSLRAWRQPAQRASHGNVRHGVVALRGRTLPPAGRRVRTALGVLAGDAEPSTVLHRLLRTGTGGSRAAPHLFTLPHRPRHLHARRASRIDFLLARKRRRCSGAALHKSTAKRNEK